MNKKFRRTKCYHCRRLLSLCLAFMVCLGGSPHVSARVERPPIRQLLPTATATPTPLLLPTATATSTPTAQPMTAYWIAWWNMINSYADSGSGPYAMTGASGVAISGNASDGNRYQVWGGAWANPQSFVTPTPTATSNAPATPTSTVVPNTLTPVTASTATPLPTTTVAPTVTPTPKSATVISVFLPIINR